MDSFENMVVLVGYRFAFCHLFVIFDLSLFGQMMI
jgi:hypothetical protein